MSRARTLVPTALLTLGLATAAFAGTAAAGELSRKEYLEEINSICADANEEIEAAFEEAFAGLGEDEQPTLEQFEAALATVIPLFRQTLDDVEALEGPSSLDKKVDKLVDRYRAVVDDIEDDPEGFYESEEDPFAKLDKQARKLGLKQCAQDE